MPKCIPNGVDSIASIRALAVFFAAVTLAVVGPACKAPSATDESAEPTPEAQAGPVQPGDAVNFSARESLVSGLVGSKHDFRELNQSVRDLCLPCHTPHLVAPAPPALDQRPAEEQPLRPYQGPGVELTGWSLVCLGCHDGITAPDVYSSSHAVEVAGQLGNSRLGTKGLRSHPVGIRYPGVTDPDYEPAAAVEAAGLLLPNGRIQCTTCHDAHNTHRYDGMLRTTNERSQMCLTCHRR